MRKLSFFVLLTLMLSLLGCNRTSSTPNITSPSPIARTTTTEPSPTSTTSITGRKVVPINEELLKEKEEAVESLYEKPDTLLELAVILSNEMANGYFDYVTKVFDSHLKEKYTIESFMTIWNEQIKDFGQFKSLTDVVQKPEGDSCNILTILQYEHNNLLLKFTFNKERLLTDFAMKSYESTTFHPQ